MNAKQLDSVDWVSSITEDYDFSCDLNSQLPKDYVKLKNHTSANFDKNFAAYTFKSYLIEALSSALTCNDRNGGCIDPIWNRDLMYLAMQIEDFNDFSQWIQISTVQSHLYGVRRRADEYRKSKIYLETRNLFIDHRESLTEKFEDFLDAIEQE